MGSAEQKLDSDYAANEIAELQRALRCSEVQSRSMDAADHHTPIAEIEALHKECAHLRKAMIIAEGNLAQSNLNTEQKVDVYRQEVEDARHQRMHAEEICEENSLRFGETNLPEFPCLGNMGTYAWTQGEIRRSTQTNQITNEYLFEK